MISRKALTALLIFTSIIQMACTSGSALDILNGVLPSNAYNLTEDVRYGADDRQTMDVYRSKKGNGITIFYVYGGAWRTGEKVDYEFLAHALTRRGYNVVIPDYRLFPQVTFPSFVVDIANAIKQYEQADSGIADETFVLMGHSAGAHTTALLSTDAQHLKKAGVQTPISALIALAGPYDLPIDDPEVAPVFPNTDNSMPVNPTKSIVGSMPPTLLLHGDDDQRVTIKHTYTFADAIRESGNTVTVQSVKGGHAGIIAGVALPLRFLNDSFDYLTDFLDSILPTDPTANRHDP